MIHSVASVAFTSYLFNLNANYLQRPREFEPHTQRRHAPTATMPHGICSFIRICCNGGSSNVRLSMEEDEEEEAEKSIRYFMLNWLDFIQSPFDYTPICLICLYSFNLSFSNPLFSALPIYLLSFAFPITYSLPFPDLVENISSFSLLNVAFLCSSHKIIFNFSICFLLF